MERPRISISRRKLLKTIAGIAATVAAASLPDFEYPDLTPQKEEVEKRFNIQLKTARELYQLYPEIYKDYIRPYTIPFSKDYARWTPQNLAFIAKALSLLPSHFYQPDSEGRKTTIILEENDKEGRCTCGRNEPYPHAVSIGAVGDRLEMDFNTYFGSLVHELTHLITLKFDPRKGDEYIKEQFDKIDQILQGKFSEIRPRLMQEARARIDPFTINRTDNENPKTPLVFTYLKRDSLTQGEVEEFEFYDSFLYGVEAPWNFSSLLGDTEAQPDEFIANLAKHYTRGKDYFFNGYSKFFNQETTDKLYSYVKDKIFLGKEY